MRDLYSDDYESVAGGGADRLIPDGVRRLSGAAVFLALIAALGLWSFRLGTRDASEVPIIKAMEGPARVEPANPGGVQAAHQGLEVNTVLAGRPAPMPRERARPPGRSRRCCRPRTRRRASSSSPRRRSSPSGCWARAATCRCRRRRTSPRSADAAPTPLGGPCR